jgi:hypothetical protein
VHKFFFERFRRKYFFEDAAINGINWEPFSEKDAGWVMTGFIWLRIEGGDALLSMFRC